jgi:hypothetical protein
MSRFRKHLRESTNTHKNKLFFHKIFSQHPIKKEYQLEKITKLPEDINETILEYLGDYVLNITKCKSFEEFDDRFSDKYKYGVRVHMVKFNGECIAEYNNKHPTYLQFVSDFINRDYTISHECSYCKYKHRKSQQTYHVGYGLNYYNRTSFISNNSKYDIEIFWLNRREYSFIINKVHII